MPKAQPEWGTLAHRAAQLFPRMSPQARWRWVQARMSCGEPRIVIGIAAPITSQYFARTRPEGWR